ncbi:hypothetical protein INT43_002396 [Umbelopsis isabellina]|uniref:Palmitoyltransferase n=1 Tax=Mortierella isabellina TaxID=91625 RepID=A0A8H7Q4Y1_MORIS|nr:hypothetical protein INT43_002396 [Umbelopsis isabellina]
MAEQQDIALKTFNDLGMTASDKVFKHPESSFENLDFTPHDVFNPSSIGASNVTDGSTLLPSVHEEGSGLLNEKNADGGPKSPKNLPEAYTQVKSFSQHQKNYQVFPGRNKFFCGGRVITSREYYAFAFAILLLLVPCALFAAFTCPWLWVNISIAVPICYAYLFVLSFVSMLRTSWTDPGIIPRNLDPSPPLDDFDDGASFAYGTSLDRRLPVSKKILVKNKIIELKYCETCRIYRPPRASHCRQCDNCVGELSLSNVVQRFSIVHVISLYLSQADLNFLTAIQDAPVSFALIILCFVMIWSVGGLTGYHCYLAFSGITTHEQLRANIMRERKGSSPFSYKNHFRNLAYILCRPTTKSFLARRKPVEQDSELRKVVTSSH